MTGWAGSAAIRIARRSMAGPSRAAPPMPDPLDPAEFDAPPPADPGADYRVLLDAMRQAGADGIAQQSAALVQRIEQDARQRLEWGQRMGTAVDDLQRVAGPLQRVRAGIWWDGRKDWRSAALSGLGLLSAARLAYHAPVHRGDPASR